MDKYNLDRFVLAQEKMFETAYNELKRGRKESHWMWYIFPQITGLGFSEIAKYYAISNLDETAAYLKHVILGNNLIDISNVLIHHPSNNATEIFGTPDNMKLRSSMTLFAQAENTNSCFQTVLDKFFEGIPDEKTLKIITNEKNQILKVRE